MVNFLMFLPILLWLILRVSFQDILNLNLNRPLQVLAPQRHLVRGVL